MARVGGVVGIRILGKTKYAAENPGCYILPRRSFARSERKKTVIF